MSNICQVDSTSSEVQKKEEGQMKLWNRQNQFKVVNLCTVLEKHQLTWIRIWSHPVNLNHQVPLPLWDQHQFSRVNRDMRRKFRLVVLPSLMEAQMEELCNIQLVFSKAKMAAMGLIAALLQVLILTGWSIISSQKVAPVRVQWEGNSLRIMMKTSV